MKRLYATLKSLSERCRCIASVLTLSLLSACSTTPSVEIRYEPSPLCLASCPEDLGGLSGPTFGDTSEKLLRVIGVYRKCVAACHNQVREGQ